MKGLFSLAAIAAFAAAPVIAAEPTTVVTAPNGAEQADPVAMLTDAAALVGRGQMAEARALYERVEKMPAGYKVETSTGSWLYPAEAARRNLLALDRRSTQLASRR